MYVQNPPLNKPTPMDTTRSLMKVCNVTCVYLLTIFGMVESHMSVNGSKLKKNKNSSNTGMCTCKLIY